MMVRYDGLWVLRHPDDYGDGIVCRDEAETPPLIFYSRASARQYVREKKIGKRVKIARLVPREEP